MFDEQLNELASIVKNNDLKEIEIPRGIKKIPSSAFSSNQLKKVVFNIMLSTIEDRAFENNEIEELVISSNIQKIGFRSFKSNRIKRLKIPNSLKIVEREAFYNNPLVLVENELTTEKFKSFNDAFEKQKRGIETPNLDLVIESMSLEQLKQLKDKIESTIDKKIIIKKLK